MKMKNLVLIASQKGGAGKTTFARALVDRLRRDGKSVAAYDADGMVGQLLQYYGQRDETGARLPEQNPLQGVGYYDIRDSSGRDTLVNSLELGADVVLHDLPGGTVGEIGRVLGSTEALAEVAHSHGYRPTVVIVMSPLLASARTIGEAVELFGKNAEFVAVKNLAFGEEGDFLMFDGFNDGEGNARGGKGKAQLIAHGGKIINMPRMDGATYAVLDLNSVQFSKAAEDKRLTLAQRSRVLQWTKSMDIELDKARELLGIGGLPAAPAAKGKGHAGLKEEC